MTAQQPGDVVERLNQLEKKLLPLLVSGGVYTCRDAIALIQSQAAELTRLRAQPDAAALMTAAEDVVIHYSKGWEMWEVMSALRAALPRPPAAQEEKL